MWDPFAYDNYTIIVMLGYGIRSTHCGKILYSSILFGHNSQTNSVYVWIETKALSRGLSR